MAIEDVADIAEGISSGIQSYFQVSLAKEQLADRRTRAEQQKKINDLKIQQLEGQVSPEQLEFENRKNKLKFDTAQLTFDKAEQELDAAKRKAGTQIFLGEVQKRQMAGEDVGGFVGVGGAGGLTFAPAKDRLSSLGVPRPVAEKRGIIDRAIGAIPGVESKGERTERILKKQPGNLKTIGDIENFFININNFTDEEVKDRIDFIKIALNKLPSKTMEEFEKKVFPNMSPEQLQKLVDAGLIEEE